MIKSNHNSIKHEQENALKFRLYVLVALIITIKVIMIFISLLTKTMNLISIDHTSIQKTNQIFSQKFRIKIYISTWNWQILN